MQNPDNETLEWCAKWIEDSLRAETNERTIEFGKNMAMTIRAVRTKDPHISPASTAPVVDFDEFALRAVEQRVVIGTERGTPIVELAEWERDGLCQKVRNLQRAAAATAAPVGHSVTNWLNEDRCMFCGGKTAHEPDCNHGRYDDEGAR